MSAKKKAVSHETIVEWVHENFDGEYTVNFNADDEIVIDGSCLLNNHDLKELPYKFASVSGDFSIGGRRYHENVSVKPCFAINTLKNCPDTVGGIFNCSFCDALTSLEFGPKSCARYFCNNCNLGSLNHIASVITDGEIKAFGNNKLIDIDAVQRIKDLKVVDVDYCSDFLYASPAFQRLLAENKISMDYQLVTSYDLV